MFNNKKREKEMKKVSCKLFFTVMWRGVCQVIGALLGLFGYRRDGRFAKCVWGLFAVSGTVIVTIAAGALVYGVWYYFSHRYSEVACNGEDCYSNTFVSREVYYHDHGDGNGEIVNSRTGKTTLKRVAWISKPLGEKDSLVVFSDGKKRGYFNKFTGEVIIPAKYDRAWVFSDGIASVEENGVIKFIGADGGQVFERTFGFNPNEDGYVFHGGYCIIDSDEDRKYGLMDTKGRIVVEEEYDAIKVSCKLDLWAMTKGEMTGVFDKEMNPVLPMMECASVYLFDDEIDMTMLDHTMRKYDIQGRLIDDFYVNDVEPLEYETEETYQEVETYTDEEGDVHSYLAEPVHKNARARLLCYETEYPYKGLMTADGHIVTMPLYRGIEAIGPDTYLCTVNHGDKVIVNGKGEVVR